MAQDWNSLSRGKNICIIRGAHEWKTTDDYFFKCAGCNEECTREELSSRQSEVKKKGFFR